MAGFTYTCQNCLKDFIRDSQSKARHGRGKYCGTVCQYAAISFNRTKPIICRYCSIEFRVAKSSPQTICSNQCRYAEQNDPTSEANKFRKLVAKGELSHRWKGGTTTPTQLIRSSADYRRWRKAVLERDNHTCQMCGSKERIQTDHIKPFCNYPELRFEVSNGRALCEPCHRSLPTAGYKAHYAWDSLEPLAIKSLGW